MKTFFTRQNLCSAKFVWPASVAAAIPVAWLMLEYFGLLIGFVVVPAAVAAYLACRFYVHRLEQKTLEISEASRIHLATVEALASAIDARDGVGVGHVRRTQIYSVGIGKSLGLDESEIDALRTGALLHDIGKLAVPDHILNKVGALTPAELEKTKIHVLVGASILEKVGFQTPVVPTVKYHHERWDGTGYPERLAGEHIPLTARILSVADAFDTLRGARPNRPALSRERARQVIQSECGRRFDPVLVDVLLRNLTALEAEIDAEGLSYTDALAPSALEGKENYVDQIKLANREVFSLYELAREFSSSESIGEAFDIFAKKVREFVPFDTCSLYLLDSTKRSAAAAYVTGENAELLRGRSVNVGQGATGFALKTLEKVRNVEPDLDFAYSQVELSGIYSTMASMPLINDDGQLIGAVTIYSLDLDKYGDEHIRLLETISHIAADAIGKLCRHDEAKTHAMTDPMTGLPNARSLQAQFDKEVARASRGGTSFQLLMLDLDGFKTVNDTFGHKMGDEILKEIGGVILGQLRDYDFLARYGGDEFVALIPDAEPDDVVELCERIERAVAEFSLPTGGGRYAKVGVSLGASGYPEDGETFDQMIVAADRAMYNRKQIRKQLARLQREESVVNDTFIVELDERHVIAASA
ncbi:MAG: diguanylate cyclase [Pyrinomonadaceae bacterium]